MSRSPNGPLRVGIGGPVGSGKTALMERCASACATATTSLVITNDIYTKEDAQILTRAGALPRGAHHGRGDRRLPAHRDPRGRLHQPRRRRARCSANFPGST